MRTALLCATALLPALKAAQGQERPLSYRGWALGISLDSATKLTKAQIGVLGGWARDNIIFGNAGITADDTTRLLYVSIASAERQMRLMEQQAESSARRR